MENVKQTNGQSNVETAETLKVPQYLDVYNGVGTFNKYGNVEYLISLPKSAKGDITTKKAKAFSIAGVKNSTVFVLIRGKNIAYCNPDHHIVKLNFDITDLDKENIPETMNVVVFHNDVDDISDTEALAIITRCKFKIPEQCGNGVLTLY